MTETPSRHSEPRGVAQIGAYAGMCLIWGSTFLAIRVGNETVAPLWAAALRLVFAALLLAAVAALWRIPYPRGATLRASIYFGALNLGLNFALLYWGERTVPSGIAAVLYATIPLSAGIFAWALGVQALNPIKTVSAAVGLIGVALIFWGELILGAPALALLGIFIGATAAALSGVLLKRAPAHSPITVNAVGAVPGALLCLLVSVVLGEDRSLPRTAAGLWPIVYLAVAGNLGAYVLWSWLLTQWTVTSVMTGALIVPVLAVALGAIVKGESPAALSYLGGLLVLGGVAASLWVGARGNNQRKRA